MIRSSARWVAGFGLAAVGSLALFAAPESAPHPLPVRVPWQTSRVVGSPEPPPPYVATRVFPNATFNEPLLFVPMPDSNRFFVGERPGKIYTLVNKPDAKPELAFDVAKDLKTLDRLPGAGKVDSLYAIAFHPRFGQNNTCFLCYTVAAKDPKNHNLENGTRISRFRVMNTQPPRLDPDSEEVIFSWVQGGHNGCEIVFGPDGYLYISTGDSRGPNPPDPLHTGQDVSDVSSSVLRIDVDHKDPGKNYAVPKDNPFVGQSHNGKPIRPEIWAYGFRNPWRMSFDRKTGDLWVGDVGWELWEMVQKVEKGGNYGWSITEGRQPIHVNDVPGPTPIRPPAIELPHTIAASVTGGFVYRGKKFPDLEGAYIFGDWEFRRLWAARFEGGRLKSLDEITRPTVRVSSFGQDRDGELYIIAHDTGFIHMLERNDGRGQNKDFPKTLSATGLFASVKDHAMAAGVIPYQINAEQWQDGAKAERWLALPKNSSIVEYPDPGKPMPSQVYWHNFRLHFPKDAVLVKSLSLETEAGNPKSRRRVETQLMHFDADGDWRAYTYAWRDDQSDADLVPANGSEKAIAIADKSHPNGKREQVWQFHDRQQCMVCHNQWPQYAIGFNLSQLNRDVPDGHGGTINQLVRLSRHGHLRRQWLDDKPRDAYDLESVAWEDRFPKPFDPAGGSVEERARAYLHVNCSHCHRFNGGGIVGLDLLTSTAMKKTKLLDAPVRGDFGLPDARVIVPGHPERSTLYYRMSKFGRDRMPHIGSEWPDEAGLKLVAEWIGELGSFPTSASGPLPLDGELDKAIAKPSEAVRLARALGSHKLAPADQGRVLTAAAKLPAGNVRDLFDGYLPPDGKGRKLGPNPRPSAVLSLTGDAERGKSLFFSAEIKCATCHKVGDKGLNVGPELTLIGKQRPREELLDSLLNPSRTVEPAFTAYTLSTVDGRTLAGLLVRRDAKEIVLRDALNKEHVVPVGDVEKFQPSRVSLMPDGQLAAMTPQEAADLLAYLVSRK